MRGKEMAMARTMRDERKCLVRGRAEMNEAKPSGSVYVARRPKPIM